MKAPAGVGKALGNALTKAREALTGAFSRLGGLKASLSAKARRGSKRPQAETAPAATPEAPAQEPRGARGKTVALVAGAAALACLCVGLLVGVALSRGKGRGESAQPTGDAAYPRAGVSLSDTRFPGAELASRLLIPGPAPGERSYPLALEPKAGYTEAEAAALRPDIGAIDVSELARRRKAEIEAIFDSVD